MLKKLGFTAVSGAPAVAVALPVAGFSSGDGISALALRPVSRLKKPGLAVAAVSGALLATALVGAALPDGAALILPDDCAPVTAFVFGRFTTTSWVESAICSSQSGIYLKF
jgi:hypothetical protein